MENSFSKVEWLSNTNVYEVNVRQYTVDGTFTAFGDHLERLNDMGVKVLWFMPITPISFKNRKGSLGSYYACSSYTTINPEFGTTSDFKNLVDKAHSLGMRVIIDWVANHTGCDHHWTIDHPSFYKLDMNGNFYDTHGWDDVIDLDYTNSEMRLKMIASMKYWIDEFNIDGFRCDMAMLTPVDFWKQARLAIDSSKPHFWLAELDPADNIEYMQVFDTAYTWKWMNVTSNFKHAGARNIAELKSVLFHYYEIMPTFCYPAWFTSNHDENSWNGTEYEKYGEMARPLAVFSTMWYGIPLIYSGQEIPNLKRLLFFDKDEIGWTSDKSLHNFYKLLLSFRNNNYLFNSDINKEDIHIISNSVDHHILSFARTDGVSTIFVFINFSEYKLDDVAFDVYGSMGKYKELFSGSEFEFSENYQRLSIDAWGYQIWYK
jgi:alpha-amylase